MQNQEEEIIFWFVFLAALLFVVLFGGL